MEEPVTIIDREVLKVLSVDTRMDILKMLSEGARTPSFIGKKLDKSDATIVEHLDSLVRAGLVKKTASPGKKWVFYSLTERGQGIISSKSRRLVIVLASSAIALIGGAASFLGYIYQSGTFTAKTAGQLSQGESLPAAATSTTLMPASTPLVGGADMILILSAALLAIAFAGIGFYIYKRHAMVSV